MSEQTYAEATGNEGAQFIRNIAATACVSASLTRYRDAIVADLRERDRRRRSNRSSIARLDRLPISAVDYV